MLPLLLVLLVLVSLITLPAKALAEDDPSNWLPPQTVYYIDKDGREAIASCPVIRSEQDWWRYKSQYVWITEPSTIAFSGTWHCDELAFRDKTSALILMDDCEVTTTHATKLRGDYLGSPTFTIYGQWRGTGTLEVTQTGAQEGSVAFSAFGDSWYFSTKPHLSIYGGNISISSDAGTALRTGEGENACKLTVGGGSLGVTGGLYGADVSDTLRVTGGTFEATGSAAGIKVRGGTFVEGGTVTATGTGTQGAGISLAGRSRITGGDVSATGPNGGLAIDDTAGDRIEISIEGGTVEGSSTSGAGIGSRSNVKTDVGTVVITGGTVTGTSRSGAGIGGGENSVACPVSISGGTVAKAESMTGAGIGGGFGGEGKVTISGGSVHAVATEDSSGFDSAGAAIGGGSSCTGYDVTIGGADTLVTATATSGAGIGCGDSGAAGSATIAGGVVYATSNGNGACIGSAYAGAPCTVSITGGKVYAGLFDGGGQTDGAGIGGGEDGDGGTITISGGEVYARSAKGGAGIGGGYGGAGGDVTIKGGKVVAWSQQDATNVGQAIGHGQSNDYAGTLTIGYEASVAAGTDEHRAQYATVSATSDGRVDACRQRWAEIQACDHKGAGTYVVLSPDHMALEVHCAHCGAFIEREEHRFVTEAVEGDPSSLRFWCTNGDCPYDKKHASVVTIGASSPTYDAKEHGATLKVTGAIPLEVLDTSISYTPANDGRGSGDLTVPVNVGTYQATARVTPLGSNSIATISTSYSIAKRPVLVCPSDQVVLRGHAIEQGVSHVALRSVVGVGQSGPATGHTLSAVALSPAEAITKSCDIEASGAKVADTGGKDVTANYDLRYQKASAVVMDTIPDYTAPKQLLGLTYDGTEKALVAPGSSEEAYIEYALSKEGPYGREVPKGRDAGAYTVWWRVVRKDAVGDAVGAIAAQAITARIAPRRVNLAWSGSSFTYDGAHHAPTCKVTNLVAGDACDVVVVGEQRDAGSYTATATELTNGNYVLWSGAELSCDFSIAQRAVKVSSIGAKDKLYDATAAATLDYAGVTFDARVAGDVLAVRATGTFADVNVGKQTVNLSDLTLVGDDAHNYVLASSGQQDTATANIEKRPIAVAAHNQATIKTKDIDRSVSSAMLMPHDGYPLIDGHVLSGVTISTDWGGPGSSQSGPFTITPSAATILADGEDVTGNYEVAYVDGQLLVFDTGPNFTPPHARALVYNGMDQPLVEGGTAEEGYTMVYSLTGNESDPWYREVPCGNEVGDYKVWYLVRKNPTAEDESVQLIGKQSVQVHISRCPVTVVPDEGQGKSYGDGDPALTFSVDGMPEQGVPLQGSLDRVRGEGIEDVGAYAITQGTIVNGGGQDDPNPNYLISFQSGEHFAIRRRVVTVAGIVAADKVYDGTTAVTLDASGAWLENVLDKDQGKLSFDGCTGAFADPAAGVDKWVDLRSIRLSGEALHNYVARGDQAVTATIAQRPGKVCALDQVVLWGEEIRTGAAYAVLSSPEAAGLRDATALSGQASDGEGGAAPGQSLTAITLAPTGPITSGGVVTPSDAVVSDGLGEDTTPNYDLLYEAGQLVMMDVWPELKPPVAREGLVYDGTEQELVVAGSTDRGVIVYALSRDGEYSENVPKVRDAGSYEVWWKIVLASDHSKQMGVVPLQCLSVTVGQREAQLAWEGLEWTYDGREHVPTATVTNLVAGDTCTVTVMGAQTAVGTYTATATELSDSNYRLPEDASTSFVIKAREEKPDDDSRRKPVLPATGDATGGSAGLIAAAVAALALGLALRRHRKA